MGEDTNILQKAVQVMCVVPKAANDMMIVGRLQGFEVSATEPLYFVIVLLQMKHKYSMSDAMFYLNSCFQDS